jgi:predicted RNase H-like nuclease
MKRDKVSTKKKNDEGIIERRNLLEKNGFNKVFLEKNLSAKDSFYKKDDFIDACSLFWSANRAIAKTEVKIPNDIVLDSEGIIMQIKV